jgi:hypothetical protein
MKWSERTAQGFSPGLRVGRNPPCLSAVVLGRWDEGGKVAAEARLQVLRMLVDQCAQHRVPLSGHLPQRPLPKAKSPGLFCIAASRQTRTRSFGTKPFVRPIYKIDLTLRISDERELIPTGY